MADATYVPTPAGFLFLAVVVDVYSRRVVGWCMGAELVTRLMLDALDMALEQRGARGVIHHSDRGSQYTSLAFGNRCRDAGVRLSMGSTGDCYDNALCESFFATLECELIDRATFRTRREDELEVFDFIEGFYNSKRRHSSIGYLSLAEFERRGGWDPMREAALASLRIGEPPRSRAAGPQGPFVQVINCPPKRVRSKLPEKCMTDCRDTAKRR